MRTACSRTLGEKGFDFLLKAPSSQSVEPPQNPKIFTLYANDKTLVTLGVAIHEVRTRCKLSQEAVAADTGADRSHMGGIERGENNVSVMTIQKIGISLG